MSAKITEVERFQYKGITCIVREIRYEERKSLPDFNDLNLYWYCGYVVVPTESVANQKHYWSDELSGITCHGGLTYAAEENGEWVIGFDCNHSGDSPSDQDVEYVKKECMELVDQLIKLPKSKKCRISDLENQIETWKRLQKTNDATIKMWQDIHQKDQQCLILFAKRLNKVTAENVELKKMNDRLQEQLIGKVAYIGEGANVDEECAEAIAMFKALSDVK